MSYALPLLAFWLPILALIAFLVVVAKRRNRVLLVAVLLGFCPLLLTEAGIEMAHLAGECLEPGMSISQNHPCIMAGINITGFVSILVFSGWFGIITIPLLGAFLLVYGLVKMGNKISHKRKQAATEKPPS